MDLYPAIDLRGGRYVRLWQGDHGRETVYGDDPIARASQFAAEGARWVHVVDLDAARTGDPTNRQVVAAIAATLASVNVGVQAGGGVRTDAAADALLDAGVRRVVVGTAAVREPAWVRRLAARHPGRVAVSLDARGHELAVEGWVEASGLRLVDAARSYSDAGVAALVVTEIGRDGTLAGPDLSQLADVLGATTLDVLASGGVGSLGDLRSLAELAVDGRRLSGIIVGRALYEGVFEVADAVGALA